MTVGVERPEVLRAEGRGSASWRRRRTRRTSTRARVNACTPTPVRARALACVCAWQVTILGTSSGASMVMMLTASPLSAGLFAHAVAQSPYIGGNYKAGSYGITARYAMASMFVSANGCSSGATTSSVGVPSGADAAAEVACLRGKPASMLGAGVAIRAHTAFDAVYGAGAAGLITYNSIECWPVVDGHFLTQAPLDAWASGVGSAVTIVVGMNADEYSLFYPNPQADYGSEMYKGMLPYTTLDHVRAQGPRPLVFCSRALRSCVRTPW